MTLQTIKEHLGTVPGISVEDCGNGAGAYLYICTNRRSLEVYPGDNGMLIECWNNADKESYEPAVKLEEVHSDAEAVGRIKAWLT